MTPALRAKTREPLWLAHILHRLSGLGLAIFLPLHFAVLGQALAGADPLDAWLATTNTTLFKLIETGLVFALALHAFGGLRLMALEQLAWTAQQKTLAAATTAAATATALLFALNAL